MSNESNEPVYFDDFKVADTRGRIIEENHYYAFGLRIDGISSKKLDAGLEGSLKNNNLYNDKELFDDADLDWYDYGFRNYDPQIGRFPQLDPLTDNYPYYTPYQYAGNEPIGNVDMDGLEPLPSIIHAGQMFNLTQTLQPIVITAKVSKATKSLSFAAKAGIFFKGVGTGIYLATDWINHNINPVYGLFNGINSQFTHQDFLNRTPMTHTQGVVEAGLSIVPYGKEGKIIGKSIFRATEEVAAMGGGTAFRYMSEGELNAIKKTKLLRGGNAGETFFTKDLYKSSSKAQSRLALPNSPALRVEFEILNNPTLLRNGTKVRPAFGMSGRGGEFMTTDQVKVRLINWQPLGN